MHDIKMMGYTVASLQTVLQPEVNLFSGESEKGMSVQCNAFVPDDGQHGVLRMQISIGAYLPGEAPDAASGDTPDEEHLPFVVLEADTYFSFEVPDKMAGDALESALKTTGLDAAIPVLRGVLVGVGSLLNLPPVFSFPHFSADDVEWDVDTNPEGYN